MGYEIRQMSFAEVLDTGFRLMRNHFGLLVGMAAIVYLPVALIASTVQEPSMRSPDSAAGLTALAGGFLVGFALVMVGTTVVFAAITWAVGQLYLGRTVSPTEALRRGMQRLLPLFGTSFLYFFFVTIGFVLLVLPGLYLMLGYVLLWPVMLIEDTFGLRALRRSRELMAGQMWRGLGIVVIMWLITAIVTGGLDFAFGQVPLLGAAANGIGQAFAGAYGSAVLVVLYFDSRCRKEAFDLEHLAAQVGGQSVPA